MSEMAQVSEAGELNCQTASCAVLPGLLYQNCQGKVSRRPKLEKECANWSIPHAFVRKLHANFDKSAIFSQDQNVMLLNELRRVRESGVDPIMHVVSNLLVLNRVMRRKDSSRQPAFRKCGLQ
jgi:hypothetical protein